VDGTGLSIPDTQENQAVYPQPSTQAPGVGFPLARLVMVICLATGAALDAAIGPHRVRISEERDRCFRHRDRWFRERDRSFR